MNHESLEQQKSPEDQAEELYDQAELSRSQVRQGALITIFATLIMQETADPAIYATAAGTGIVSSVCLAYSGIQSALLCRRANSLLSTEA
jgi:hypothetical protein